MKPMLPKCAIVLKFVSSSRVIFKRNSWLVVLAENVKIQYFFKKIFNSCICVLVDNGTMEIQKKIEYINSHILENIVK